jgi:hypothetical protein
VLLRKRKFADGLCRQCKGQIQNHSACCLFVIIVFRKCDNTTCRVLLLLCLVFRSCTFDLYDDAFPTVEVNGHVGLHAIGRCFIDLEGGFLGKAVSEISVRPQNCQNGLH